MVKLTESEIESDRILNLDKKDKYKLIKNPNTSLDILKIIAYNGDLAISRYFAKYEKTPTEILDILDYEVLINYTWEEGPIKRLIASHPNVSLLTLENNIKYMGDFRILYNSASNPILSIDKLFEFSESRKCAVSMGILSNPNRTTELLDILSYDSDSRVRLLVARDTYTSLETLERLSKDKGSSKVRNAVFQNDNSPDYILLDLLNDIDFKMDYLSYECENLSHFILEQIINLKPGGKIIKNPNLSLSLIKKLLVQYSDNEYAIYSLLCHTTITKSILKELSNSEYEKVRGIALYELSNII